MDFIDYFNITTSAFAFCTLCYLAFQYATLGNDDKTIEKLKKRIAELEKELKKHEKN